MNARRPISPLFIDDIWIGNDPTSGAPVSVPFDTLCSTSVHVVGSAGAGKSYWIRHLIDTLLDQGIGVAPFGILDPHSELVDYALEALSRSGVRARHIVLLDPADRDYVLGFNPLMCGVADPSVATGMVMDAFLKGWGAASFDATPRLELLLRSTVRLLIDNGLTLREGLQVLDPANESLRRSLRERVTDPFVREDFLRYEQLPRADKLLMSESTTNRLRRFMQTDSVQLMLSQTERTVDLRRVLDDGQYLLVNLGGVTSRESQRLLGALLLNGILAAGKQRDSRRRRDYFVIVDECGEFATRDVAAALDQLRKFGVHMVLSHQRMQQLQAEDGNVANAVLTNCKVRLVFGGLSRPECEIFSQELFTGEISGNRVKHVAVQTKFRPILDTFEVESESWGDSFSESSSISESTSFGESDSAADTESYLVNDDNRYLDRRLDDMTGRTHSAGRSHTSSHAQSLSSSSVQGSSTGGSRSLVPITRHEEFREETGRTFYTIEEERERFVGAIHGLPKRQAFLQVFNQPTHLIVTPDVEPERQDRSAGRYRRRVQEESPYLTPAEAVTREIAERQARVIALAAAAEEQERPMNRTSFRERIDRIPSTGKTP